MREILRTFASHSVINFQWHFFSGCKSFLESPVYVVTALGVAHHSRCPLRLCFSGDNFQRTEKKWWRHRERQGRLKLAFSIKRSRVDRGRKKREEKTAISHFQECRGASE